MNKRFNNIVDKLSSFTSVDGGLSEWSEWTKCDAECGTGRSFRSRDCSDPPPSPGGKECQEEGGGEPVYEEEKPCQMDACKGGRLFFQ